MADVFQIIAINDKHTCFEKALVNGDWHIAIGSEVRTGCGVQLDGEDGVAPGPTKEGYITCDLCLKIVNKVKEIRNWTDAK